MCCYMCSVTCVVLQRGKCPLSAWPRSPLLHGCSHPTTSHQLLCPHPRDADLELGHHYHHTFNIYIIRDLLLFSYCRFLISLHITISDIREIFYLGRQSINLTQITFTEKFSCALAPSSISMVRFILCCGNTNININSIEVVPAAVASPAPACRQLWGSAAALQTTLPLGATLTAHLKTWKINIVLYGQIQNKWKR